MVKYSCAKCLVAGLELGRSESECVAKLSVSRLLFGRACLHCDWSLLSLVLGPRGSLVRQNTSPAVMSRHEEVLSACHTSSGARHPRPLPMSRLSPSASATRASGHSGPQHNVQPDHMVFPGYQLDAGSSAQSVAPDAPCREAGILHHALHWLDKFTAGRRCAHGRVS